MTDLTGKEKKLGHEIREGYPEFRVEESQESFLRVYNLNIEEQENVKVDRGRLATRIFTEKSWGSNNEE